MNRLYRAPAAPVGQDEAAFDSAPPPPQVRRAVRTFWTVLVLGLVTLHPWIRGEWWKPEGDTELPAFALAVGLFMAGLFFLTYAVLTFYIGRRRNWARWAMLVVLILGWVLTAMDLPSSLSTTPAAATADLLMAAAELWACFLIFRRPGAAWFRRLH